MDKFGNHDLKGAKIGVSPSLLIEGFFLLDNFGNKAIKTRSLFP